MGEVGTWLFPKREYHWYHDHKLNRALEGFANDVVDTAEDAAKATAKLAIDAANRASDLAAAAQKNF